MNHTNVKTFLFFVIGNVCCGLLWRGDVLVCCVCFGLLWECGCGCCCGLFGEMCCCGEVVWVCSGEVLVVVERCVLVVGVCCAVEELWFAVERCESI